MASTDINGSMIVILTKEEALSVYYRLRHFTPVLNDIEETLLRKIIRDLKLEKKDMKVHPDFKSRRGTWRLSNEQLTIKVEVDSDNNIQSVASVAHRFVGQSLNNLIRWMDHISKTDIVLLRKAKEDE